MISAVITTPSISAPPCSSSTGSAPSHQIAGQQQDVLGEDRRPQRGSGSADDKADRAEAKRLLQDHRGDGPVACPDQLEHGDLAHLVQGHGVDDEGDDGRTDNRQDDQEHEDLLRRRGDQLGDEDVVHVGTRIGFEVLPAPDLAGDERFIGVRREP